MLLTVVIRSAGFEAGCPLRSGSGCESGRNIYIFEDSAREFEGMLIGKNALRHYVGGKEAGKVNS